MKPNTYTMTQCSNPSSVGIEFIGESYPLDIGKIFFFGPMYSSTIQKVDYVFDTVTIVTKNTTYKFKKDR